MVEATFKGPKGQPDIVVQLVPSGERLEHIAGYLMIDGVRVSPEALRLLLVTPNPRLLLAVRRSGDQVTITAHSDLGAVLDPDVIELRKLESTLAYEQASGALDSYCLTVEDEHGVWLNTQTADDDVTDEMKYLHARRLLDVHPETPHLVRVRDESEPLPEVAHV